MGERVSQGGNGSEMNMATGTLVKWRRQILAILNTVEEELKSRGELDITSKELRTRHKQLARDETNISS